MKRPARDQPHFQNFLKAVKSRNYQELNADVAIGVMSASLVHLAFPRDKEATTLLTRKYRAPYIVPEKV